MENKEKFDFAEFIKRYPNSNGTSRLSDNPVDRERYTEMYYADDEVSTIDEFVDKLDALDESA